MIFGLSFHSPCFSWKTSEKPNNYTFEPVFLCFLIPKHRKSSNFRVEFLVFMFFLETNEKPNNYRFESGFVCFLIPKHRKSNNFRVEFLVFIFFFLEND